MTQTPSDDKKPDHPPAAATAPPKTAAPQTKGAVKSARRPAGAAKDTSKTAPAAVDKKVDTEGDRGRGTWGFSLLALVVALSAAGGGVYLWQQQLQSRQQQQVTIDLLGKDLKRLGAELRDNRGTLTEADSRLRSELTGQQQRLASEFKVVTAALERLRIQVGRDQESWRIAEVEYLLQLANQRLQLAGDHTTAIKALEAADRRLADLADPRLLGVRQGLVAELQQLHRYASLDRERVALELGAEIRAVATLPLQQQQFTRSPSGAGSDTPATEGVPLTQEEWRKAGSAIWDALKGLVTIRHNGETARPLLAPDQQRFLRLNLQLKLETARLALLEGSQALYHASLNEAVEWLEHYFDMAQEGVVASHATLQRLAPLTIAPPRPDISGSLHSLRQHQAKTERREAVEP